MNISFEKKLVPESKNWVTIPPAVDIDRDIFQKPVRLRCKDGSIRDSSLEVTNIRSDNQALIRANFTENPGSGSVKRDGFYLTQQQLDSFIKEGSSVILDIPH